MKYVIIGNSIAAVGAIEGIRSIDNQGKIAVISDEENYSRPLISYWLGGKIKDSQLVYRDEAFYRDNNVKVVLGKVGEIDLKNKIVKGIEYDKLLIATGGKPIVPDVPGLEPETKCHGSKGIFTFTRLEDAERIKKYINENRIKSAVVLGGGLIGLKATEALMDLGLKVMVIELADRLLPATFDQKTSQIISKNLEKLGCQVITGNTVTEVKSTAGKISMVVLKTKKKINTKLFILAVGVMPNIDLAKDSKIKVGRGIIVNEKMQTSVPDIYAAGDVVEFENRVIAILPNAFRQGKIAGINMAGGKAIYDIHLAMNSVELAGIPTISAGLTEPKEKGYEIIEKENEGKNIYKKLVLKDNRIEGFIFVMDIDRAGIYTGLIKDKVDVTPFKENLLRDDFGLVSLPKEYRKHIVEGPGVEI